MGKFQAQVEAGFQLLNDHFGGVEWVDSIDWFQLDMDNENWCVLGQLFGSYTKGLDALDINSNYWDFDTENYCKRFQYGFSAEHPSVDDWESLQVEWTNRAGVFVHA